MALAGELAKYIGNEIVKTGGKELAKAGAKSALSSLVPSVATKVGADLATKAGEGVLRNVLVNQSKSVAEKIPVAVGDASKISLYRGMHADSPANLQKYIEDMKNPNIVPRTYTGNAFAGDGYHFYDNIEGAREYARDGINLGEPYGAVVKIDVPKNRFIGINSQNGNDAESFIGRALERGAKNAPEVGNKNFRNYIQRNGILGSHNTSPFRDNSQYVVMNNDATAGLEAIENYENGELMKDIVNSGADKYLPKAPTQIKFNKDLSIRKTGGNFGHKGVKGMRGGSAPKTQQSIDDRITLYRGLEQEYDPNYPVAKLDTFGYESWTDNPELAEQYGDYVYSIDVPKADIKDGYLDENPNSPTYGDRNPIYIIDKKAGLNGISGNEYLLEVGSDYQKGLTYNRVQQPKIDLMNIEVKQPAEYGIVKKYLGEPKVSQSLVELSPEQQEFFKDSVIRDNSGMLKKMYHGSPNGKIKEFNPGSYFTENKEYADGYQNPEASSLMPGARKIKNTPKTYEVYLNIKKPFTLSDAKAKDIYFNEYIKGGNSAYYDPYGTTRKMIDALDEVDWTEGVNLMEWLQENHPEYDGMYLDEGGAGGYSPDNEYVDRGKSVVNFRGDQVKILN